MLETAMDRRFGDIFFSRFFMVFYCLFKVFKYFWGVYEMQVWVVIGNLRLQSFIRQRYAHVPFTLCAIDAVVCIPLWAGLSWPTDDEIISEYSKAVQSMITIHMKLKHTGFVPSRPPVVSFVFRIV